MTFYQPSWGEYFTKPQVLATINFHAVQNYAKVLPLRLHSASTSKLDQ